MSGITHPFTALCVTLLLVADRSPIRAQSGPRGKPSAPALAIDSLSPMSAEARDYLATALDTIEVTSMHRATIDWRMVRDSAFLLAAGARGPSDTYGAIQWALRRADKHSFLQARFPWINPILVDGRFGYVRVPFYSGASKAALTDSLQEALRDLDGRGACGWIVDLRMNGGGNVWPMTAGIGPLLGDSSSTAHSRARADGLRRRGCDRGGFNGQARGDLQRGASLSDAPSARPSRRASGWRDCQLRRGDRDRVPPSPKYAVLRPADSRILDGEPRREDERRGQPGSHGGCDD